MHYLIEYNWPTLCTDYHSFIWYAGSYMFRHPCAIFRELLMSLWVAWRQKWLCCLSCHVMSCLSFFCGRNAQWDDGGERILPGDNSRGMAVTVYWSLYYNWNTTWLWVLGYDLRGYYGSWLYCDVVGVCLHNSCYVITRCGTLTM
jgi:hypothetical protein